ncbi:hypothetical protein [Cellulosimicrobium cellulans]|uniref:phage tail tube protein n=1 Tax=Cellulosimicrobium cellulans TaxID=1710 RepID=UPI003C404B7C
MAKDVDNIHVYGSDDDTVWLAPLGSTLPTTLAAPDAAFEDVGYLGEDGIDHGRDADVQEFRVHQAGKVVRKKVTSSTKTIVFRAVEDNDVVAGIADNVISSTTATGVTTRVLSDAAQVAVRACVIDLIDDGYMKRLVIPRLEIVVTGTQTFSNSSYSELECEGTIVGSYTEIVGPVPA